MKYLFFTLCSLLLTMLLSCQREELNDRISRKIQFEFNNPSVSARLGTENPVREPKAVLVTIVDESGKILADRQELSLYKFGNNWLTLPLTLEVSIETPYRLTEFFVVDENSTVTHVTPHEGSKFAHLVNDPLDIDFSISKNQITTVYPEVLAVTENSDPKDYGYGQFGFHVVETIPVVFSSFIQGASNFELTEAHLTIEGFDNEQRKWKHEYMLEPKANILQLKKAELYKITATKPGFIKWEETRALSANSKVEILLQKEIHWTPEILWSRHIGGSKHDQITCIIATRDGGSVGVGKSFSDDYDVSKSPEAGFAWVVKYDGSGSIQWSKTFGYGFDGEATSISEYGQEEGYLVTGWNWIGGQEPKHAWIMKLDNNGNIEWRKDSGLDVYRASIRSATGQDQFILIAEKSHQSVIRKVDAMGITLWQTDVDEYFPSKIIPSKNGYLVIFMGTIVKINEHGVVEWKTKKFPIIPGVALGWGYQDVFSVEDGYVALGSGTYNVSGVYQGDLFVVKFDLQGNVMEALKRITPDRIENINDAVMLPSGNLLGVGYIFTHQSGNYTEAWLVEITAEGEIIREKKFNVINPSSSHQSYFLSIHSAGNSEFVISGQTSQPKKIETPNTYGNRDDVWIQKIRP